MYLSRFNMLWFYKPGHTMTKPDALSRREDHTVGIEDDNKGIVVITPDKIRTTILIADDGDMLKQKIFNATCLLNEVDIQRLCKKKSANNVMVAYTMLMGDYTYIPNSNILWMEIIQKHHDSPVTEHPGYEKTIELLQRNYWWPGMATLVKEASSNHSLF